jgi:RHH-type proline utilization regulon transcriptional repressor/proline dehydrogenase/delta 1-pyrroline-5-carboxylate dehydrogenase
LAALEVYEVGKTWREADADVAEAIDFCEYYAREAVRLDRPRAVDLPGEENVTGLLPRGVCVVIAPWNFPLAILAGMTTAALVTGNAVVMKPAEQSSLTGLRLHEVLLEAGVPPGALQFLPGRGEDVGPALVTHPATSVVAFTGSRSVGLGSDLDGGYGVEQTPADFDRIRDLQRLTEMLSKRGYTEADIAGIMHGNWLRFLRDAWRA